MRSIIAAVLLCALANSARAQLVFGTNTGTFADYLDTYGMQAVPLRGFGTAANPFSPSASVDGPNGSLVADFGSVTSAQNYANGVYTIQFDSPSPVTINTAGMFGGVTSSSRVGTHTTLTFNLAHDAGGIKTGTGWFGTSGVSASNPVTNFTISAQGTNPRDMTAPFSALRNSYGATRWMNNLNINNNVTQQTPASLVTPGYNAGQNSYDDVVKWTNEQPSQKAVMIELPVNQTDAYVAAVAQKMSALAMGKTLIVEYGNEDWNGSFAQLGYIQGIEKTDARVTSSDDFGRIGEETGILASHMMDVFKANYTGPATLKGFLGSQGTNTYFVQKERQGISEVYGPSKLASNFGYQGISFYPGDAITSASSAQDLFNQLEADLPRQVNALIADRQDAASVGLAELVYEWSPNGYLTRGGVSQSVIDAFRASPLSKQWTTDELDAIKSNIGAGGIAFDFDVTGDGWSTQIDPLAAHEPEQQAIDAFTATVPEPAGLGGLMLVVMVAGMMARRRPANQGARA
jgi:hypothetical protein